MTKLTSEALKNDGSFYLHDLLTAANDRLNEHGKHGKRAKLKRVGKSLALQFNFDGQQQNKGCNCSFSKQGIKEAEKIAELVTGQLSANIFNWNWYNLLIGKKSIDKQENKSPLSRQLITDYKQFWFHENKQLKSPDGAWYRRFRYLETVFSDKNQKLSDLLIKEVINLTPSNSATRTCTLQALTEVLNYLGISDYNNLIHSYKSKNKIKVNQKNVPSDTTIKAIFKTGFIPSSRSPKKFYYRYPQWQFLYGLLATYGLRIHEAWHIANWDKPVILHQGDWMVIETPILEENSLVVPAILDPENKDKILCIKHNTKTGYRMAIPLSPQGENWLEEFNLLQPLNLPDIKDALTGRKHRPEFQSDIVAGWFRNHDYGFTPHALRHAYNHRGHQLGHNPTLLSKSLGHSLNMNSTTYLKTMPDSRGLQMMKDAIASEKEKQSEMEILKAEIEFLKQENEKLKTENHLYKSLLEQIRLS